MKHFYEGVEGWYDSEGLYSDQVNKAVDGAKFVEIGSFKGKSACYMGVEIINSGKKIDFFCVDTFEGSPEHQNMEDLSELLDIFKRNIEPVKDVVKYIKSSSVLAAEGFDDESLDFVFIDADHSYESVKADIKAWLPKVKKGGILSGHDYNPGWPGVIQAVDELFPNRTLVKASWVVEL